MHECRARLSALVVTAVVIVAADQITKLLAEREDGAAHAVRNYDGAFGIFSGPVYVLVIGALLTLVLLVTIVRRWLYDIGVSRMPLALIAGGAVANLYDRVRLGAVRDFIPTPWAVINVADLCVIAGVVGLLAALAWRLWELRLEACTVVLDTSRMRPVVVARTAAKRQRPQS